jgi:hypothetical protein
MECTGADDRGKSITIHAFVDESGDRAFTASASRYFVMSALLYRTPNAHRIGPLLDHVRKLTGRGPGHLIHFNQIKQRDRRQKASDAIGEQSWLKAITLIVDKQKLPNGLGPSEVHTYNYCLRYLLERLSWLGRVENEVVEVTNAHIVRHKIADIRSYEAVLKRQQTTIAWNWLDPRGVQLSSPKVCEPLQIADLIASAFGAATNGKNGIATADYALAISPRLWRYRNVKAEDCLHSYGLKFLPNAAMPAYPWAAGLV